VITQLATYAFTDGEMELRTLHPGVSLAEVKANLGWEPRVADRLEETPPPSDEELRLLRELDPGRAYL
jgi:glutaconate CoA-transferase subunit B